MTPIVARLVFEWPLRDEDVAILMSNPRSIPIRKSMLMRLRSRGLVTDEQVTRAFADHPELGAA